jgi:hypothetical protein
MLLRLVPKPVQREKKILTDLGSSARSACAVREGELMKTCRKKEKSISASLRLVGFESVLPRAGDNLSWVFGDFAFAGPIMNYGLTLLALAVAVNAAPPRADLPPNANPAPLLAASVRCDAHTRFVLLTDNLFRAEYDGSGVFEDRATLSIINRAISPAPLFDMANDTDTWCNITTKAGLSISYRKQADGDPRDAPFRRHHLSASVGNVSWQAAKPASGNLGGTVATLSGRDGSVPLDCTGITSPNSMTQGDKTPFYCTLGVASRDGWAVVNDTLSSLIDPGADWVMRNPRASATSVWKPSLARTTEDIYVFMYGNDYRGAVGALATISGAQAVPPRHSFGVHWSRYWQYSGAELRAEVKAFEDHALPLDLLNLDTGWHENKCAYLDQEVRRSRLRMIIIYALMHSSIHSHPLNHCSARTLTDRPTAMVASFNGMKTFSLVTTPTLPVLLPALWAG